MTSLSDTVPGRLHAWQREGNALLCSCNASSCLKITVLTAGMVRVRFSREQNFAPRRSWSVTYPDETFGDTPFTLHEDQQAVLLSTSRMHVRIERDPLRISCRDMQGRIFCADQGGIQVGPSGKSMPVVPSNKLNDSEQRVACSKRIEADEHFYGFGERTGHLDKTGRHLLNWTTDPPHQHHPGTDPLYMAIPILLAVRPGLSYGVFFNNTWRSRFSLGYDTLDEWMMEAENGELDYYIVYGPTPAEVTEGMSMLLGRMPLPPRWSLGHHQSRWSYSPEQEVRNVAAEFRRRGIPCDAIHLDIDYMHGYRVFTWDSERFPDPAGLIGDLRAQGFRIVTIIDPGVKIDPDYPVYQAGVERGMFITHADGTIFQGYVWPDAAVFADYTRPEVREWWGDLHRRLVEQGVSGVWNDMNEPAVFDRPFSEGLSQVGTVALEAEQGPENERTTHAEVHNLFGSGMAQACYEGLKRHMNNKRPFVLTRSGFAGIQRWGACWMGDNNSWWQHLEMSMPQLMNMGLSGVPFVATDVGGFFDHTTAELLVRWIQFGILSPMCRNHAAAETRMQEPWAFDARVESIYRDYVELRYRLMPYLYSLFWEASEHGSPVLRPLLYHFPDDVSTYELHDQVMFGPAMMAAPVYHPGRVSRAVYLPAGEWFDWWNDQCMTGPTHVLAHAPLERMPLYVRAGSIIPMGPVMNYTDERPLDPLTLELYPGDGSFTLYEDDGETFAYQQGAFCTTRFSLQRGQNAQGLPSLTLTIGARTGDYRPAARQMVIRLHAAEAAMSNGHPGAHYDAEQRLLTLQFADDGTARTLHFQTG